MFPLRFLSLLFLCFVFIHGDDETTETLIETKGDKLKDEETTETEWVATDGEMGIMRKKFLIKPVFHVG